VKKYGTEGQATDDNIIGRMRVTCWITNAIDIYSEWVILILFFNGNKCHANAPEYYVKLCCAHWCCSKYSIGTGL